MTREADVYGRGWKFPPTFSSSGVVMTEGIANVRQSMRVLFQTQPRERIMRPNYGCDLQSAMFCTINEDLLAEIQTQVTESIFRHEPRAALESVDAHQHQTAQSPNTLQVDVLYRLAGSQQIDQLSGRLDLAQARIGGF